MAPRQVAVRSVWEDGLLSAACDCVSKAAVEIRYFLRIVFLVYYLFGYTRYRAEAGDPET